MKYLTPLFFLFLLGNLNAQDLELYDKETYVFENDTLKYRILKPSNFNPNKQYPVHLFLHGAGERGDDNISQLTHGGKLFLKKENREKYNSWVIFPQCSENDRWPNLKSDRWNETFDSKTTEPNKSLGLVIRLMDEFIEKKQVDKRKIYVSGLSMGGMGTFEILYRRPDMFAAATPICGSGSTKLASSYADKVPVWIFHGSDDKVVSPIHSLNMVNAIIESGGSPKMTLYENVGHGSWGHAFAEENYLKWIHSKTKPINPEDIHVAGGGTIMDWAYLKKYQESNEELVKISDPDRVVFMGNSITEGWSHFNKDFFIDNPFVNRGIGGQTTPQMLIRFKPDVVNLKPKSVVIMAGTNDIAGNTGPIALENTAENIISMAEIAMANNIKVYICSTLPAIDFLWSPGLEPAGKVIKLNSILKKYCVEKGIAYVDYYSSMADSKGGLKVPEYTAANDLVHPNLAGYKVMEKIILSSLKL